MRFNGPYRSVLPLAEDTKRGASPFRLFGEAEQSRIEQCAWVEDGLADACSPMKVGSGDAPRRAGKPDDVTGRNRRAFFGLDLGEMRIDREQT